MAVEKDGAEILDKLVRNLKEGLDHDDEKIQLRFISEAIKFLNQHNISFEQPKPEIEEVREKLKVLPFPVQED